MKKLLALLALCASASYAAVVPVTSEPTRTATTTSSTLQFFNLRQDRPSIIEVSSTSAGTGTLYATTSTDDAAPTTTTGYTADPAGGVATTAAWMFPAGLTRLVFAPTSGAWVVRVAQPR